MSVTLKLFETNNRSICASRSVVRIWLCSSVRPSILSAFRPSEMALKFFLIFFCIKFEGLRVRKVTEPDFLKKVMTGEEGPKSLKNAKKWGYQCFDQNFMQSYVLFFLEYEGLLTFCKHRLSGKNLVLELWTKNFKDQSDYKIL